jgi:hypothetical protein
LCLGGEAVSDSSCGGCGVYGVPYSAAVSFYFLPSLVALWSKKRNIGAIAALNILAGWTGAGWIIALVWALAVNGPAYRGESG